MQEPRVHLHHTKIQMKINQKQSRVSVRKVLQCFRIWLHKRGLANEKGCGTDKDLFSLFFFLLVYCLEEFPHYKKIKNAHSIFLTAPEAWFIKKKKRKQSNMEPEILQQINNYWLVYWEILCRRFEVRSDWFVRKLELSLWRRWSHGSALSFIESIKSIQICVVFIVETHAHVRAHTHTFQTPFSLWPFGNRNEFAVWLISHPLRRGDFFFSVMFFSLQKRDPHSRCSPFSFSASIRAGSSQLDCDAGEISQPE